MQGIDIQQGFHLSAHKGLHWTLIVVCYPSPACKGQHRGVLHLDSLPGCNKLADYIAFIYDYLTCEWQRNLHEQEETPVACCWTRQHPGSVRVFDASTMPTITPAVPEQRNFFDCGLFVLTYLELCTGTIAAPAPAHAVSHLTGAPAKTLCVCEPLQGIEVVFQSIAGSPN
ncbi:TPA: hypothetical protein ACH3X1_003570 [Trebouxia sp. C0004]